MGTMLAGLPARAQGALAFQEVWGYLMKGEERFLRGTEPITDIGYFSAQVNDTGRLDGTVPRPALPGRSGQSCRVHLVVSAPANKALMYFCLAKDLDTRGALIRDIVQAARGYDGVQIDFEALRAEERSAYLSFLGQLKRSLPASMRLSVALPARTGRQDDAFSYAAIAALVDRVLVMAYDEHWRTGPSGPIASKAWCRQVCAFAQRHVPAEKLVMGLPLYGRLWQEDDVATALKYPETLALWEQRGRPLVKRPQDNTPCFSFQQTITAMVYFEDTKSLAEKLTLYQGAGVRSVGFWRIGQGPSALWDLLTVSPGR